MSTTATTPAPAAPAGYPMPATQPAAPVAATAAGPGDAMPAPAAAMQDASAAPGAPPAATTDAPSPAAHAPATTAAPAATGAAPGVAFPLKSATSAQVGRPVGHAAPPQTDAGSIGGAIFSLLLVIGLIVGLGWLARRMPGMQRGTSNAQLRVVASVALGPRERAMVLDVGGTQLLVGVGQGGVRTLHVLEHPLPAQDAGGTAPSPFAQVLAQHFGRKP